ncbi:MAG: hypothetical protein ACHQEM_04715 [Chitinophagales bacterium]
MATDTIAGRQIFALKKNLDSLAAGIIGFYIIYLLTRHSGIGLSPDSVNYLSVARNFREGKGLVQFDHIPLVDFPGCYPVFLGIISFITRLDPLQFAPVLNGCMFALLIYTSGSLMNGFYTPSKWYKLIILSFILFSPCLLEVFPMLWSETLFIVELLFFLFAMSSYFRTHKTSTLLVAAAVASIAAVTRYAGITIIATGCFLITFDFHFRTRKRFLHALLFGSISSLLIIINLARNLIVFGYSTGMRQKGVTPLWENMYYYGSVLCEWLPFPKEQYFLSLLVAVLVILLLFLLLLPTMGGINRKFSYEEVATAFGLVYSLFIIFSATVSRYQQLNSRLLSPLFIPFIWAISFRIPRAMKKLSGKWKWAALGFIVVLTCGFQYNQLTADYETYDGVRDAGVPGYTEDPFPQSDIVKYIEKNAGQFIKGYTIYSNAAEAVYLFTGLSSDMLPQLAYQYQVDRFLTENHIYLVWFNEIVDPDVPLLKDILARRPMVKLQDLKAGSVWISEGSK